MIPLTKDEQRAVLFVVVVVLIGTTIDFLAKRRVPAVTFVYRNDDAARIDINTSDCAQLDTLPGIGPTLAQRIIDHRREHGEFRSVDDLSQVQGVHKQTIKKIKPFVRISGR